MDDTLKPFTGQLDSDSTTSLKPFSGELDKGSTFKSGSAFEDTKDLIPDVSKMWEQFKSEWANRKNTPMTPEVAQKMMQDEHAAGSGVLDAIGALPAMAVGGVAGLGSAVLNMDASKGLQTGGKVMNSLMPSTLLGNEDDQKKEGYKAAMAPYTVLMDTLNAAPQGYGEMLNAAGHTNAAGQLTDAGKLAIMATMGVKGAHEAYKAFTGKAKEEAPKLVDPRDEPPAGASSAPAWQDANDLPLDNATAGHADDFAAVNPYDMGGHVTAAQEGRPSTIDNAQPDLFGSQTLEDSQAAPKGTNLLDRMAEEKRQAQVDQDIANWEPTKSYDTQPPTGTMRDAFDRANRDKAFNDMDAQKQAEIDAAHADLEKSKQADYAKMEAQRELDHMNMAASVEQTPGRNFFTDPTNRDKLDFHTVDPRSNPHFNDWFGNSKIVDESGKPMLVYHGTMHDVSAFKDRVGRGLTGLQKFLKSVGLNSHKGDFFFAKNPDFASVYAGQNGKLDGGNVIPTYVRLENPVVFDALNPKGQSLADVMHAGRRAGNDGVIVKNWKEHLTRQDGTYGPIHSDVYIAFDAKQIKSAVGNRGTFDPTSARIDHQFAGEELGDKSLMDHESTGELVNHLANGDVHSALDVISQNHENVGYRNLANYLKDKLDGIRINLHDDGVLQMGDRQATGYYDPTTRTVGLSKVGAVSPHTVLHELIHAVTSDFINNRPNDLRVMGLKDLYNKLNALGMSKDFPGITNVKEFVAEAHSNPEFQDFLKDHRVNTKSAWQRFVDNVRSILGVNDPKVTTALDHAMDLSKQVIEAKDASGAMEQFKAAGVPSKLADLMVTRQPEKPNAVVSNENMKAVRGIGKIKDQFDFTPLKPEEVIPLARSASDIPASTLETIKANLDAGGRFASLRHNNNPVVKYTFAYVDHAVKNYERWIRENVTNPVTGIKSMLGRLPSDDFTAVHQQLMLDEGQLERTPQQMRELGWSEKMVEAAQRLRQVDRESLARVNEARAKMNPPLPPVEPRIGHLAGRFLGDFYHTVYELKPDGTRSKAVMMLTDHTSWGAQKLADYFAKEHPEWEVSKQDYNSIKKTQNSDRFSGFMELMNFIGRKDPEVAKALDSLDKYNRRAATNYLNTLRHAKEKKVQPGGIIGSEGHKSWVDAKTNAEEGFKGHLAYLDTTAKWVEMQKAMENISKVVTDKEVTKAQPNAIKWSTAYTDHALHRNQGFLTEMAQSLLSETGRVMGIGHTNITKGINWMSSAIMRNWMGIGNIPFALKHMLLPFQKMPAMMAYLKTVGDVDASMHMAGMRSLSSYYHYLKETPTTPFERQAFKYAKENNIFSVTLDNLSGAIQSSKTKRFLGKVADADFSGPEHAIRGTSFFFYAHLLEKSGMGPSSALSAAEHLSKFLYTDYAPHEAPRAAAKAGWIGQLAFQITRYKANELGQLGFFNRERLSGEDHSFMEKMTSNLPLMAHLGSLLAFTGVTGMLAYKEMDEAYSLFRKYVMGSPDNLTALLQRSKAPELVKYGMSSLLGIDSKISEAELLPAPFPTTAAELNILGTAAKAAWYHDQLHAKQLALTLTPSTFRGPAENQMFTQPQETSGPHAGKSLYLNPNTGEGRVWRTPEQQSIRNLGFHTTAETDETENSFAQQRIMNDHRDIADHILDRAKGLMASNALTQQAAQDLGKQYAAHQQVGQPDFSSALTSYAESRHISQREQMELKASRDRMGNSLSIMQRNK